MQRIELDDGAHKAQPLWPAQKGYGPVGKKEACSQTAETTAESILCYKGNVRENSLLKLTEGDGFITPSDGSDKGGFIGRMIFQAKPNRNKDTQVGNEEHKYKE